MAQRNPKSSMASTASSLSNAASQMLRSLGLEEVDPELVFELQKKEGAGAFGRVFRACYKSDPSRLAALKVIPVALEAGQRGEDVESVRREIQFLRECDHPNVVAFYGAYYKDSALWLAMEYCGGGSVGDVSRTRRLAESEIAVIMRGALRGLAYLHSKKKIHRDIKGGNILLTASGQVKIADFGVSAQLRDTMSRRGTFVGTPYWMSPEMIQDSDYDYKSDIWSLGITAIELADQKPPLFDEHPMRVLIQIPRNPSPQLKTPSAWTPLFSQFLQFCLQKDPLERPTALECLDHTFVRAVDQIERVFSSGGGESIGGPDVASIEVNTEVDSVASQSEHAKGIAVEGSEKDGVSATKGVELHGANGSSARSSDPAAGDPEVEKISSLPPKASGDLNTKCDDGEDIAEDIAHLDDDNESGDEQIESGRARGQETAASDSNSDDYDERSRSSSSSAEDERSLAAGESFQFRQPAAASDAGQQESLAMISGDELLQLSVSESFELPVATKIGAMGETTQNASTTSRALPQHSPPEAEAAPVAAGKATPHSSSSTEFRLLPSKSASPRTRDADKKPPADDSRGKPQASERLTAPTLPTFSIQSAPDDKTSSMRRNPPPTVTPDPELQRVHSKQQSEVTTTPKSLARVSSSWQNPLADIDTALSHPRVNVLLSSLSLSSSLSTRLFTQLLRDEEQGRADTERNTIGSSYATPQGAQGTASDFRKQSSFQLSPSAVASPPVSPHASGSSRHARRQSLTTASPAHCISSPFRVAHNMCVTFNPIDARFEGAPASEEWAALHRQFGIPLAQMRCGNDRRGVPALLHMLRRELLKRDGLATKHIYRLSPEKTEVQSVKAAINSGSVDHSRVSDPHVYASLIKQWFRELPTLLLAALNIDDLTSVVGAGNGGGTGFGSVESVLAKLPQQERIVFEWLLEHMLEVVDKSHVNKMTAQSIAVVMAPNLFSFESLSKTLSGTNHAAGRVADFLSALLEWKQMMRRSRRSGSVSSSANRSLLLTVEPSSAATAGSSTLSPQGSTTAVSRSGLETMTGLRDTSQADENARTFVSTTPSSFVQTGFQLRPLSDADQPLETAIGLAVDGIWRELETHGIHSTEMILNAKHELSECFERYQHSILKLVANNSKRGEERNWAESALTRLASGASVQNLTVPTSLGRVKRWVSAALSADEFARLLRSERTTKDKVEHLHGRYPMWKQGFVGAASAQSTQQTLDLEAVHDLFRQISVSSTLMANSAIRRGNQGNHTSGEQDLSGDLFLEGALQLTHLAASTVDENQAEHTIRAQTIVQRGKHEPMIGNLLAGLGNNALVSHLELEESQGHLLATVESALHIQRLTQP